MRAVARGSGRSLEHHMFKVNQAQLDSFHKLLCILGTILMRALARGELFNYTVEEDTEIPFPVAALECGVRLLLAPLLGQLLSELPLYPL